ncbi:MAG: flagellar hook-length control protein FliK [Butyrivibrio sp.]|nr:flagellar hook-length control protein FliK [Acetatifactor muris]MCM1558122.1 flagellar hook-length control protein FliK [Butyrivibrio sp.]
MTSTPVKNVGFGPGGAVPAGNVARASADGGFQAVWNNQAEKQTDNAGKPEEGRTVKKAPGDSLKARDEHRARTEKREPSRNVEERTDIPEEKLEEAAEVLGAAADQMIQEVADAFGIEPEEVQAVMADLGLEQTDVLSSQGLSSLILALSGEENPQALLTDETLYGSYQELMGRLQETLQECSETLEVEPKQLTELVKPEEKLPVVEVTAETAETLRPEQAEKPEEQEKPVEETPEESFRPLGTEEQKAEQTGENETAGGRDRRENRQEGGREQEPVIFAQTLKAEQYEPQVQQAAPAESVWDADTQNIMRQIMDYMKVNLKADMSTMEMQLHPASLGTLQVQVAAKGGVVTASFITQNEAVKAALESQMVQLQQQFEEQGVKVEAIEVTVQTHQFEQNLEQGRRGGQEQEPGRRGRTRRINLNDALPPEEMEAEDVLARDIMTANGNTVDYTA